MKELLPILKRRSLGEPKVFVTTYSLYNQGKQFANRYTGFWISVDDLVDNLDMIEESFDLQDPDCAGDHEYMFTDYAHFPKQLYSECGIDWDLIQEWNELSDGDKELVDAYCTHINSKVREAIDMLDGLLILETTKAEYAEESISMNYDFPSEIYGCIDFDKYADEIFTNVYQYTTDKIFIVYD